MTGDVELDPTPPLGVVTPAQVGHALHALLVDVHVTRCEESHVITRLLFSLYHGTAVPGTSDRRGETHSGHRRWDLRNCESGTCEPGRQNSRCPGRERGGCSLQKQNKDLMDPFCELCQIQVHHKYETSIETL